MNFAQVSVLTVPEGAVVSITRKSDSVVLWKRAGLLPSAYRQVEYIETDGNQYVDTGVLASEYADGISYSFKGVRIGDASASNMYLWGCLNEGSRSGNMAYNSNNTCFFIYIGGHSNPERAYASTGLNSFTMTATCTSEAPAEASATYNGSLFITNSSAQHTTTTMPEANIYLLTCNLNGNPTSSTSQQFIGRLNGFTMDAADGTPIRNFVPCYRVEDGVIGLYDTVEGVFYENAGTGSFTKGADVTV